MKDIVLGTVKSISMIQKTIHQRKNLSIKKLEVEGLEFINRQRNVYPNPVWSLDEGGLTITSGSTSPCRNNPRALAVADRASFNGRSPLPLFSLSACLLTFFEIANGGVPAPEPLRFKSRFPRSVSLRSGDGEPSGEKVLGVRGICCFAEAGHGAAFARESGCTVGATVGASSSDLIYTMLDFLTGGFGR